jgi:hypothetical protein
MQQPYKKGVANHLGPESCADGREAVGEALTGGHAGQPLSSEITTSACRPSPDQGKATRGTALPRERLPDAAESETLSMRGSSMRENRETSGTPMPFGRGTVGEGTSRTPDAHVPEESDDLVVPTKRANNAGQPAAAESVEGRGSTKGNSCTVGHAPDTVPGTAGRSGGRGYGWPRQRGYFVRPEVRAV